MAEAVQEKSHGMKFAEQQLLRHGWEQGKGLGRAENGISEAIKVKVKCNKGGVGHKEGEQFSFHWWDHVFNKASSSLQVEADHNGVQLKKTGEEEGEEEGEGGMVSNKKPRKAALEKSKLYGCFVKSATLLSGSEQPEPKEAESEDSSSEEDDETLDLSSTTRLSDSVLMKVCGGRTAHKGARHGLTMSAKLARLEQQEAEFMAKYGRKSQSERCGSREEKPPEEEKKNKSAETESVEEETRSPDTDAQPKKKKKKKNRAEEEELICLDDSETNTKKKKKKRRRSEPPEEEELICLDDSDENTKKKQKKKKKKKKTRRSEPPEEEEEVTVKTKRKKCKKNKTDEKKSKD